MKNRMNETGKAVCHFTGTVAIFMLLVLFTGVGAYAKAPVGDLLEGVKPGPDGKIDVLTINAHPDDESIFGGGTLLTLKQDPRVRLWILCLTNGDKSDAKESLGITEEDQGRIRMKELELAGAVYNAEEVINLEYHDQDPALKDTPEVAKKIAEVIDRTGAEIVITHDPIGIYGHPDHIACHKAAVQAFRSSDAERLYFVTIPRSLSKVVFLVMPYKPDKKPSKPTIRVNIRSVRKKKRMACYSHVTQMRFTSLRTFMPILLLKKYEYFTLAPEKSSN